MTRINISNLNSIETLNRNEMKSTQGGLLGGLIGGLLFGRLFRRPRFVCRRTFFGPRCFVV